ncbi:hypothetical protein ACFYUJ_03060 [Streptomyces sp. NPDC004520]|uniref:hypothetical protein n=1 Tax=Streptomyces sp. NPDC004520 TaxID=3364702 RepID=UPI00369CDE3A
MPPSSTRAHTGRLNEILAGNYTAAAAAQQLAWEQIAATWVDVDDRAAARTVVVDNRTNDLAGYDTALFAEVLSEMPDLGGTGYDRESVDRLLDDASLPETLELTPRRGEHWCGRHCRLAPVGLPPVAVQASPYHR